MNRITKSAGRVVGASMLCVLLATGCRDYGDYEVAEQRWVDDDAFPSLAEIDWSSTNLPLSIGSELHARAMPQADWPEPLKSLLEWEAVGNNSEIPAEFDLAVPDACLYVDVASGNSRFQRVEVAGRSLLFLTYLEKPQQERNSPHGKNGERSRIRFGWIDESKDFRVGSIGAENMRFEVFVDGRQAHLVTSTRNAVRLRTLDWGGHGEPSVSEPVQLFATDDGVARVAAGRTENGELAIAVVTERLGNLVERRIYFGVVDPHGGIVTPFQSVTSTATGTALTWVAEFTSIGLAWIDARFIERGFNRQNTGKLIFASLDPSNRLGPPMVLNDPLDSDEDAFEPILAGHAGTAPVLGWTTPHWVEPDSPLKIALLDPESRTVTRRRTTYSTRGVHLAVIDYWKEFVRTTPIPGHPVPATANCEDWDEMLPESAIYMLDPVTGEKRPVGPRGRDPTR